MKGRKPMPPDLVSEEVFKVKKEQLDARKESWKKLQTTKVLRCPVHLTPEAKKEWRRIMRLYEQMEVEILSDLDRQALIMYCEAVSIYNRAQEDWAKMRQVVSLNESGQRVIDNLFKTMEKQTRIISSLSEQLCLTPVGRARMGMNGTKIVEEDPFTAILKKISVVKPG